MNANQQPSKDQSGGQLFWKITLTIACVVAGAIVALYLFRIL
jgi:hypothetical protein